MVKVFVSPWCPWCREVTESIVFNLLKGKNIEVVDPASVDTRVDIYSKLGSEPAIYDAKNRCFFISFLTKNHYLYLLRYLFSSTKELEERLAELKHYY